MGTGACKESYIIDRRHFTHRVPMKSPVRCSSMPTATREQYTSSPAYELIDETEVDLHGRRFHQFRFKVSGTKGLGSMHVHVSRDGEQVIGVHWTFPVSNQDFVEVPLALLEFDKGVKINPAEQSPAQ